MYSFCHCHELVCCKSIKLTISISLSASQTISGQRSNTHQFTTELITTAGARREPRVSEALFPTATVMKTVYFEIIVKTFRGSGRPGQRASWPLKVWIWGQKLHIACENQRIILHDKTWFFGTLIPPPARLKTFVVLHFGLCPVLAFWCRPLLTKETNRPVRLSSGALENAVGWNHPETTRKGSRGQWSSPLVSGKPKDRYSIEGEGFPTVLSTGPD